MDHVVYVDAKEKDLQKLLDGAATMLIRGAAGRKLPHGRVNPGDRLFFIPNDGRTLVRAQAVVSSVMNSDKLSEEQSAALVQENMPRLQLAPAQVKRWSGKRYLVLIGLEQVQALEAFGIDRSAFGNMDDWLPVGDIESVRIKA